MWYMSCLDNHKYYYTYVLKLIVDIHLVHLLLKEILFYGPPCIYFFV